MLSLKEAKTFQHTFSDKSVMQICDTQVDKDITKTSLTN